MGISTGRNSWTPIRSVKAVNANELSCTVTNMEFFEKIKEMDGELSVQPYLAHLSAHS
jgi:hypothetical protein